MTWRVFEGLGSMPPAHWWFWTGTSSPWLSITQVRSVRRSSGERDAASDRVLSRRHQGEERGDVDGPPGHGTSHSDHGLQTQSAPGSRRSDVARNATAQTAVAQRGEERRDPEECEDYSAFISDSCFSSVQNLRESCWKEAAHFFDLPDFLSWKATGSLCR